MPMKPPEEWLYMVDGTWRSMPPIGKLNHTIGSDGRPITQAVRIGEVVLYFSQSRLIGVEAPGVRSRYLEAQGELDGFSEAESYIALVKKAYVALANETTQRVEEWVDAELKR